MIQCWCEQSIPPFSVFWIKEILNPSALAEPIAVVFRPENDFDQNINEGLHTYSWDPVSQQYDTGVYVINLRMELLTNGIASIPAKTVFSAKQAAFGMHWLRYDTRLHADGTPMGNPEHRWFFLRTDSWALGSAEAGPEYWNQHSEDFGFRIHGAVFYRIGRADQVQACVPVVMFSADE